MAGLLNMKLHELASVATLAILVLCLLGMVKLNCKASAGMQSNPAMWATGGGVTRYGTQRTDSTGGANDGSATALSDPRAQALGLQGFVSPANRNGFTVGGHEAPVFWNPGDYAEIAAQQGGESQADRAALLAGTVGSNLMSGGNRGVIAANRNSMEGMLQPNY